MSFAVYVLCSTYAPCFLDISTRIEKLQPESMACCQLSKTNYVSSLIL